MNPKKRDKVLNIGISNIPEIELAIENNVAECWTIDLDKKKLRNAGRYLKKTRLIEGDLMHNNLPKNYFDTVVILEVLEHLEDDKTAVEIINALLKKGGKVIASSPNNDPIHIINPVKYIEHKRHYSNWEFKSLFSERGFKIDHFNVVESWRLLFNLYIHLLFKFVLRRTVPFGLFGSKTDRSYKQQNVHGLDLIVKATKVT
jgi:SAM-dependent methyltransferase